MPRKQPGIKEFVTVMIRRKEDQVEEGKARYGRQEQTAMEGRKQEDMEEENKEKKTRKEDQANRADNTTVPKYGTKPTPPPVQNPDLKEEYSAMSVKEKIRAFNIIPPTPCQNANRQPPPPIRSMLSKAALSHWNSRRPSNNETGNSTSAEGEGRETNQNM